MLITPSFKKSLIVEEFQGNYLKSWFGEKRVIRIIMSGVFMVIPQCCIAHPHCAPYLRHLRARMSVSAYKTWDFPQTKLDSEIYATSLLNKHGDIFFMT